MDKGWRAVMVQGALSGLRAGAAYWIIECLVLGALTRLVTPGYLYQPLHSGFTIFALGVYLAVGAVLGLALALAVRIIRRGALPSDVEPVGAISLALLFGICILQMMGLKARLEVLLCLAFAFVSAVSIWKPGWARRARPFTTPWAVAGVLLINPWARTLELWPGQAPALVSIALVLLVCWLFRGAFQSSGQPGVRWALVLRYAVAIVLTFAVNSVLTQGPILTKVSNVAPARAGRRPNVILITLDTVRADHLSVYGYQRDTTPNLEKLVRDSSLFTSAIASSNMTLPTHGSIFTGLYASQHGAHWVLDEGKNVIDGGGGGQYGSLLPENSPTLARKLAEQGYRTIGIVANSVYLKHEFQLDQGFEYYSQPNPVIFGDRLAPRSIRALLSTKVRRYLPAKLRLAEFVRAGEINREAFQLLDEQKSDHRPFFMFLNYMDAHQPHYPLAPYDTKYAPKQSEFDATTLRHLGYDVLRGIRPYPDAARIYDESQYDGGIAYLDSELGRLFAKLKELNIYDQSLIIVTADHGEGFGSQGVVGHGFLVYQSQVSVPLIIKYPGAPHATVVRDLASQVDILPTVLDSLGYPLPPKLPGRSLLRAPSAPVTVIAEAFPSAYTANFNPRFSKLVRAEYSGSFKLITGSGLQPELYNLASDPQEEHNLYAQDSETGRALEASLQHWITLLPVQHSKPALVEKQMLDRLKSLGYLQ